MRRRTFLRSASAFALVGAAGCTAPGRPEIRMESGRSVLHPVSEQFIANGLQPHGRDRLYVTATADSSPDILGPDADSSIVDVLTNSGMDQFHVVVQLRSSPVAPMELWPAPGHAFEWIDRSRLRTRVVVEPWGSLDRIDDRERRDALRSADELVHTAVWSLTPGLEDLPSEIQFVLAARN
ncbi:MAG: hypothetical protein ACOCY7_01420 [Halodesulfurarchaeum sp.]